MWSLRAGRVRVQTTTRQSTQSLMGCPDAAVSRPMARLGSSRLTHPSSLAASVTVMTFASRVSSLDLSSSSTAYRHSVGYGHDDAIPCLLIAAAASTRDKRAEGALR